MKKRTKIIIGVVVVLVLALVIVGSVRSKDRGLKEVTIATVKKQDLVSKVSANGRIEAQRKVDLSANVMGQIVNLAVREGDKVEKGDFLLQIDQTQLAATAAGAEASLRALFADRDAARASLAEAQRNLERTRNNFQQQIIPQAELETAQTAVESAQANLRSIENRIDQARAGLAGARDTLSKTTIRAPMSGLVTALPVEEGEVAVIGTMNNPGTVLLTISDMSLVEAVKEVDETDVPRVEIGQKATVTIDAFPDRTFEGLVTEVASSPISQLGGGTEAVNFEVRIQLQNPDANLRPGFSASGEIITATRADAVAIPIQALVVREKPEPGKEDGKKGAKDDESAPPAPELGAPEEEEGVYVYKKDSQTVEFQTVKTGITGDIEIEITEGLKPDQEIVTGPFRVLREIEDGDKVKIEEKKGKGKGKGEEEKKG